MTLRNVYEFMQTKRDLIIGIVFRPQSGANLDLLEVSFDQISSDSHSKKSKDCITLDSCFQAFSREELLTGSDQWYCKNCKEQRDIQKKLELYRLPKILIVQLKRFQNRKSSSGQSGFHNMAYAQMCSQEKVGDLVDFPINNLNVRPYIPIASAELSPDPIYYDLYAVSNHYGSLHGGHYTAFAFNALS